MVRRKGGNRKRAVPPPPKQTAAVKIVASILSTSEVQIPPLLPLAVCQRSPQHSVPGGEGTGDHQHSRR